MPPKRPASDMDDNDENEDGREVKKQRTVPHRGILGAVMQDFLDALSPATGKTLAEFNKKEERKGRDGVVPINMFRVETELKRLQVAKDIESLDAKVEDIDSYLKGFQDECIEYIVNTTKNGPNTYVTRILNDVIWQIQAARSQLLGMFSYWKNYCRKLDMAIHRY